MTKSQIFIITFIIIISIIFRFIKITENPVGLTLDETGIGYDAYSILKTGRDEYGKFLPLAFRSIDDYKPPVLIYFMVPSIALFGLNEFAVRFPVALFSVFTVFVTFFLARKITKNTNIALLTSFFLAISPWHVYFSRVAYEAIIALFFLITGIWLLLKSFEENGKLLWLSAISFSLSMYSYHTERVFVPVFLLVLAVLYYRQLLNIKKQVIISAVVGLIISLPLIFIMISPTTNIRAQTTFITKDIILQKQFHSNLENLNLTTALLDNNFLIAFQYWAKRYLNYFDPSLYFLNGHLLTQKASPQGMGLLYLFELPLIILGFWRLIFQNFPGRNILIIWFILAPIVSSLTIDEQHPLRTLVMLPVPHIIAAVGFFKFWAIFTKKIVLQRLFLSISLLILFMNILYFRDIYWIHFPLQRSEDFADGFKEKTLYALENQNKYNEIVIDSVHGTSVEQIWGVPYLYFLFYGKYDPQTYQIERKISEGQTQDFYSFNKYIFKHIDWPKETSPSGKLYVASIRNIVGDNDPNFKIVKTIYLKNGLPAFQIVIKK